MTRRHSAALGILSALVLLLAAWQASAGACTGSDLRCGPAGALADLARGAPFLGAAAATTPPASGRMHAIGRSRSVAFPRSEPQAPAAQAVSLLLLGVGLALAARSLRRQKS